MKYDIILWDLDGTLLDYKFVQREALKQIFRNLRIPITNDIMEQYSQINEACWRRFERGEISRAELLVGRFRTFFAELGLQNVDVYAVRDEYEEVLGSVYEYLQDSLGLCKMLQPKCRQFIVTNGTSETQRKKISLSGFKDCMEACFISEEIGYDKPDTAFFTHVFAQIKDFDPKKALIIGDTLTSDIKGGIDAGIATCYFNAGRKPVPEAFKPDYEIDHLWDILRILDFMI